MYPTLLEKLCGGMEKAWELMVSKSWAEFISTTCEICDATTVTISLSSFLVCNMRVKSNFFEVFVKF